MQGTQEHDDMARAISFRCGEEEEKTRAGAGVEEGRGRHCGCIPPPPGSTSCPWLPSFTWPPKIPSLVCPGLSGSS